MVYSGGSSTVTEPLADAQVVQCSIDDIVNVYVSSVHLAHHMAACVGDRSSWLAKGQPEVQEERGLPGHR